MNSSECPHSPVCPLAVTRWSCGQRTLFEDAVKRGLIQREPAARFLAKIGCPMTPMSRVNQAVTKVDILQSEFEL